MLAQVYGGSSRLDRALSSIPDHLVIYDRLWRVTFVNEAGAALFKRSRGELVGRCVWELMPELVGTRYFANVHRACTERQEIRAERCIEELGVWLEEHIHPYADGVAVLSIDITARKAREQAQQESVRRLEECIALAAHEIRGPLAPVESGIGVLRALYDGTPVMKRTIEMLERQTRHISRLVDDLLDASRVTRDKIEIQRAPHCMNRLVEHTLEDALGLVEGCGITLSLSSRGEPLMVDVDADRIAQVLRNVVTNACKYTDPGGRIDVRIYKVNGRAVVEIEDDGIGIPSENLESIFEMFAQVPEHRFRSCEGLGVGLALARAVLRLHDGTISAFSAGVGLGSRFTITLPLLSLKTEVVASDQASASASCAEPG